MKLQNQKYAKKPKYDDLSSEEDAYSAEGTEDEITISEAKTEDEQVISEAKTEDSTQTTKTEDLKSESNSKESQSSGFSFKEKKFDTVGLTRPDPFYKNFVEQTILAPIAQEQPVDMNIEPEVKVNQVQSGKMQIEKEDSNLGTDDLQKAYFRMVRKRMLDILSSCSMTEE